MSKNKKVSVIMLGPDLDVKGGVSFVVKEYLNAGLDKLVDLRFIATHRDGTKLYKVWVFIKAYCRVFIALLQWPSAIVHLHMSQNGSFVRKFSVFFLAKIFGKRTIVQMHGGNFEEFMLKNKFLRSSTRWMFSKADKVLVLSYRWKTLLNGYFPTAKLETLYNPIGPKSAVDQAGNSLKVVS